MNTKPDDAMAEAYEQAMRTHAFYETARDLLVSDLPGTAELLGIPRDGAARATRLLDEPDEPDLLFQLDRGHLVHAQFLDGLPSSTLGTLLLVHGKVLLEKRSARLDQYVVLLDHRRRAEAASLERAGGNLDLRVVPVFDVPFDRLLSRPTWAPLAALPRPHGPEHRTAIALAERAIRGARRQDQDRLLGAVEALKDLP